MGPLSVSLATDVTRSVEVVLVRYGRLDVHVVDARSAPLVGSLVTLSPLAPGLALDQPRSLTTGPAGLAQFTDVVPGLYLVETRGADPRQVRIEPAAEQRIEMRCR